MSVFREDISIEGRNEHNLYYIENWTILFDMKIVFLTTFNGFIKMKKVLTHSTFDLLHKVHISILRITKELEDYLIVAVSTDELNALTI